MRYDTKIFFQKHSQGSYNSQTGDYINRSPSETACYANVTEQISETIDTEPGKLRPASVVIRFQNPISISFETIRIGDRIYAPVSGTSLRRKQTINCKEVGRCQSE